MIDKEKKKPDSRSGKNGEMLRKFLTIAENYVTIYIERIFHFNIRKL